MTIDTVLGRDTQPTKAQLSAGFQMLTAVSESIRKLGEVPSGHIYALLMDRVSLQGFEKMVAILKNAGLISESGHMLTWIGPRISA